jgi:hypothetical protein
MRYPTGKEIAILDTFNIVFSDRTVQNIRHNMSTVLLNWITIYFLILFKTIALRYKKVNYALKIFDEAEKYKRLKFAQKSLKFDLEKLIFIDDIFFYFKLKDMEIS